MAPAATGAAEHRAEVAGVGDAIERDEEASRGSSSSSPSGAAGERVGVGDDALGGFDAGFVAERVGVAVAGRDPRRGGAGLDVVEDGGRVAAGGHRDGADAAAAGLEQLEHGATAGHDRAAELVASLSGHRRCQRVPPGESSSTIAPGGEVGADPVGGGVVPVGPGRVALGRPARRSPASAPAAGVEGQPERAGQLDHRVDERRGPVGLAGVEGLVGGAHRVEHRSEGAGRAEVVVHLGLEAVAVAGSGGPPASIPAAAARRASASRRPTAVAAAASSASPSSVALR